MPQNFSQKYSDEVLEEIAPRAARLLNAIGAVPVIRTLMLEAGMTATEVARTIGVSRATLYRSLRAV